MSSKIQVRRDTHANWVSTNPKLSVGEIAYETDTGKFKIGNGNDFYIDINFSALDTAGGNMHGEINMNQSKIVDLQNPTDDNDATNKTYVDFQINNTKTYADTAVSTHNDNTTSVHGIADTAQLASKTYANTAVSTHNDGITNVHGIADTSALATKTYADTAVNTHNSATTNVHGIVDTSELATKTYASAAAGTAQDNAEGFATTAVSTHNSATTSVHGIADTSALATKTYADTSVSTHNSATTSVHGISDTSALATKTYADSAASGAVSTHNSASTSVHGITDTSALATKTYADTSVSTHNSATTSVHGIADTSALATKTYAETYTNTQITNLINGAPSTLDTLKELSDALGADKDFATTVTNSIATKLPKAGGTMSGNIAMGSNSITGLAAPSSDNDAATKKYVDDQTTTDIAEGTNLYFTDERAQDAIGNNLGTGLSYDDASGAISVNTSTIQARVTNVSDTEIGYLDGVTSAIQTQINSKFASADASTTNISEGTNLYFTDERAQDAIGNNLGTGLSYNDSTGAISVNTSTIQARVSGVTDTEIGYLDGVTSAIQTQIDSKLESSTASTTYAPIASPTFTGTVSGVTKTHVGLGNVDNTSDTNKPVSTATQTALDLKANLASPTFTGTVTLPSGTVTSSMIADSTIVNADISSSAAIALSKLATDPLDRANHTGTQAASTISDFDTQVRTSKVTDLTAPTGSFSMNSQKITNLLTPTSDNDAANKAYVDAAVNGINIHESVIAATTGNVNLTNAVDNNKVLDGVTLSTGNRILVKNQNTASQNGIYIVASTGAPTRATDYDLAGEVSAGDFIFVKGGTLNANTGWIQTSDVTTVGTDSISFTQFSGAGTYTANTGLTLTGTVFSIDTATTVDKTTAQTLTNKTLTSPTLITPALGVATATSINGTSIPSSATLITTSDTGTVTNTMLAGSIANNKLSNSTTTIGSTAISLGSSVTTIAGLTSVTSTGFTGALTGNADTATKLATARNINGVSFDGSAAITVTAAAETLSGDTLASGVTTSSLTTVGTITSGTWSGTTIALNKGGTGATTQAGAANAILPIQTSNSGKYLTTDGTNVSWGSVSGYNAPTIGSTSIASGSTVTTIAGLSSVTSTSFVGALTGNADTVTNGVYTTNLASGVLTFLGTPTSANLAAALTDETGSTSAPKVVFSNTPAITAPLISTKLSLYTSAYIEFEGSTLDANKTTLTVVDPTAARTITLPNATGTVVLKDSTDTFTNKTFDTAGTGNSFSINGTAISAVTGTGSAALSASPTFTGTVGAAALTTTGNVIVGGDLTVNGTTTTVNSTTLAVADSNIEIAKVASPTDVTANGAGITIKGATDKTINWYSSTGSFLHSENVDVASGKTYKIAGTDALTSTQVLGKTVPSGTILGTTDTQTLTNKSLSDSTTYFIDSSDATKRLNIDVTGTTGITGTLTSAFTTAKTLTLPDATDTLVGKATTDTLTNKTMGASATATTVSLNTATTVDTTALSGFTTIRYILSIKQGSKVRSSEVMVQTDGSSVDSVEYGILETGGKMTGIAVAASVSSTNMILTVTITDASGTNATVKLQKIML